ncbi:ArsR/SmtB family transcription factor [Thalassomonas actiniarum]|uniref:Winged helix-turn-helix transcriptional regulator n=1 Tax=Thalassomonas actiniarum TaxID=485447 RepID=A0AAF0BZ49_9GAMM|nr:winged helix-turn-helix domain-containing protein [Thalassomonas actiniarum]WDD97776.1 winged helix-turn-helix transcriptional regulator [Thalassomonas actiniarum]
MQEPDIATLSAMIAEPARAKMLIALMAGKALTATELALEGDITAQTASSHLAKLVAAKLLVVRKQGRHKYFQLSGADIAQLLETLLNISAKTATSGVKTGPADPDLRLARICYDHLAGEMSVALYDSLLGRGYIRDTSESQLMLTALGQEFFSALGLELEILTSKKRPLCKSCLDWSERRFHLAGSLGQWILEDVLDKGWAARDPDSRVIRFNKAGLKRFNHRYLL